MSGSNYATENKSDESQELNRADADALEWLNNSAIIDELMIDLIDDVSCGLCFEVHRASKMGTIFLDETDSEAANHFEIVDEPGLDVFGQPPSKKQFECICPSCQRNLAASRFAPHLEKCMGMGRISSRIASRRIASGGRKGSDAESDGDDNSNDVSYAPDHRAKRPRRDRNHTNTKRSKAASLAKVKAVDSPNVSNTSDILSTSGSQPSFDILSFDEKKNLMINTCGVISEHTQKMCTRSLKCPQHSDKQRQAVRKFLLGPQSLSIADDPIDVDSLDDLAAITQRSLVTWDRDTSSNPSPCSSTSTLHSSSSRKQKSLISHSTSRKRTSTPTTTITLLSHTDVQSAT